ncbi:MAG TPA: response regulator [Verrucomicrobiae bacterium]|jgi:CheY-like chemotaxis protein|nr:response regulator [Verrucomicrobiae bacterium]
MRYILVIDDNDDLRSMISAVLVHSGFTVNEARNADTAIAMIQQNRPDLILSDVRMPGMDGYSLLSTVRNDNLTAPIPFILMTGSGSRVDFRRGMASGADDYLFKPFAPEELVEAVLSRLSRQSDLERKAFERAKEYSERTMHQFSREAAKPIGGILQVVTSMLRHAEELTPAEALSDAKLINESALELDHLARSITT